MLHRPKVQVSCIAIRDNQIALIKRLDRKSVTYNHLIPPGGHVELHETLEQTCTREMAEETGLHVSGLELKGVVSFLTYTGSDHGVCFFFIAHHAQGELALNEPEKLRPYWIPIMDISSHPQIPDYYKQIIARLIGDNGFINARVEWFSPDNRSNCSFVEGGLVLA